MSAAITPWGPLAVAVSAGGSHILKATNDTNVEEEVLNHTVDGRNPANQLRLVVYPIIYQV